MPYEGMIGVLTCVSLIFFYSKGKSGKHKNSTQNGHELLQSNVITQPSTHNIMTSQHSHLGNGSRVPLSAAAVRTTSSLYGANDSMSLFTSGTGFGSSRQNKPVLPPVPHTGNNTHPVLPPVPHTGNNTHPVLPPVPHIRPVPCTANNTHSVLPPVPHTGNNTYPVLLPVPHTLTVPHTGNNTHPVLPLVPHTGNNTHPVLPPVPHAGNNNHSVLPPVPHRGSNTHPVLPSVE